MALSSRVGALAAVCGMALALLVGVDRMAELPAAASAQLAQAAAHPAA